MATSEEGGCWWEENTEADYVWVERDPITDPTALSTSKKNHNVRRRRDVVCVRVVWCGVVPPSLPLQDFPLSRADFEDLYRHYHGRHCESFEAAVDDFFDYEPWPVDPEHGLQILSTEECGIQSPCDHGLPHGHDTVFILKHEDRHFLVNTEGHSFCKFTVPCRIVHRQG